MLELAIVDVIFVDLVGESQVLAFQQGLETPTTTANTQDSNGLEDGKSP